MMRDIAVPAVNNVIHLPNERWEKAWFRKETFDWYRPKNVIWLEEGKRWLELIESIKDEDTLSVTDQIRNILNLKWSKIQTAQIIQFPKRKIA